MTEPNETTIQLLELLSERRTGAVFSPDQRHRYALTRYWDDLTSFNEPKKTAVWLMLNPSTADETNNDPTIRRVIDFTRNSMGCNGLVVANIYALRSPKPKVLWKDPDPVGPDNDLAILAMADHIRDATWVAAWGGNARADRVAQIRSMLSSRALLCLGTTEDGQPRHPLYLKKTQPLIPWMRP